MSTVVELEKLLDVDEALEVLNISRTKLYQLVREGELPAVKMGRCVRFRPTSLREYIANAERRSAPASANLRGL